MRIQSVNNYNNINNHVFKANNAKNVVTKLDKAFALNSLKQDTNQLSQKKLALRNGCLVTGGIMGISATVGMLHALPPMVLPAIALAGGLTYTLISMKPKFEAPDVAAYWDKIKSGIRDVARSSKFDNMTQKEIIDSYNYDYIKSALLAGKIDLANFNLSSINFYLLNSEYSQIVDKFIKRQLSENYNRELPMHRYNSQQMVTTIMNLRNYPDIVAELMCSKNIDGETPIHKYINDDYSEENFKNISDIYGALSTLDGDEKERILLTIFEEKNAYGISAKKWLQMRSNKVPLKTGIYQSYSDMILYLLGDEKRTYEEKKEIYEPYITNSEFRRQEEIADIINSQPKINYESIMRVLNSKIVKRTNGLDLNLHDNYTAEIIEFLINNANSKERQKIIAKLQELDRLDYDKVDDNGISVAELVMNAEDEALFELIKISSFKYRPELDYAYNNIQNPEFKENVKRNLKIEFVELENAIDTWSAEKLEKYISNADSPLYDKKIQGKEMQVPSGTILPKEFDSKYRKYYGKLV